MFLNVTDSNGDENNNSNGADNDKDGNEDLFQSSNDFERTLSLLDAQSSKKHSIVGIAPSGSNSLCKCLWNLVK